MLPQSEAPLVSIIIPCYNQAQFLADSIESALTQTYGRTELVVVDDGSSDNTAELAARYPVRYIRQPNRGVAEARNCGFNASAGEYVIFLDADDRLTCDSVQAHLHCLAAHPGVGFVVGEIEWIDSKGLAVDLLDPEYDDPAYRQSHFDHIQEVVEVFFLLQTADEAYEDGQARGLAIGPINSPDDLFDDVHLQARDFFVSVEHDDVPPALYPGVPFRFSGFGSPDLHRAPKLGEHTGDVFGSLVQTEVPADAR